MDTNCFSDLPEAFWRSGAISWENSFSEDDYWAWQYLTFCNQGVQLRSESDELDPTEDSFTDPGDKRWDKINDQLPTDYDDPDSWLPQSNEEFLEAQNIQSQELNLDNESPDTDDQYHMEPAGYWDSCRDQEKDTMSQRDEDYRVMNSMIWRW